MRIEKYENTNNIMVKFLDEYNAIVHSEYRAFKNKTVKNPYFPSIFNKGIIGNKYNSYTKEYKKWHAMLCRCFDDRHKNRYIAYKDVTCCEEWLLFENFYEWLHKQENFEIWIQDSTAEIDKDILCKGNKIYSPKTCCLVPRIVNNVFINRARDRGDYPVGVTKHEDKYRARCDNPLTGIRKHIGVYDTPENAFLAYKEYKEKLIKQIADIEFSKHTISQKCYDAMYNYEIEITD